ncbi:hypothetical protein CTA2_10141 [Colletotrichum tanaceti]|uniref:Uncharacterized protein n=1 Tax=Colletotrichum tanaceti TaxID=1306861 RepID=A0A4U6XLJ6_9PEZI|nr:hypothetical protein CTA2_10141 [Colletotrichum tanaceti]TKW56505.1 hypothetical protein CTA1_2398 [Colletotrichum tanaceti]
MLSEQKQKNDSLGQAYSSLHAEYLKLRGVQSRTQQVPRQHTVPPMAYDSTAAAAAAAAHMVMPTHTGTMGFADNMYMFQDMQSYTL